jgi:ribonuclease HI
VNCAGNPVANADLIMDCRALYEDLIDRGIPVDIDYVPAHIGCEGNECADALALTTAIQCQLASSAKLPSPTTLRIWFESYLACLAKHNLRIEIN